ncbi:pentapeptide repeat-containing protein [Campylobacter sp. W0065]|nr:pentapeptide repeat-containing protein [Campylobacter sp. W0065]
MDSENFIEGLKLYGILAREGCEFNLPEEAKIKISNATIESIDFDVLQRWRIKELTIENSKISKIKISKQSDVEIHFESCDFLNQVFALECNFQKEVSFSNCIFEDKANFKRFTSVALSPKDGNYNESNILFENCIFNKRADFHSSKIANGIYFTDSHFKDYADFHACKFEKNTCFYGAKFEKVPNFSACYFKDQKAVNLINVDIDKLNFKSVENYIKDNYKDKNYKDEINETQDEKSISKIENKYKLKCAKDCKDSFRVIKDVLTNQNNTLEAQEWHKLELCAKEVELKIKLSIGDKMLWYDRLLLHIYRNTSNHHLDFVTILNFTVSMISIYGLLLLLLNLFIDDLYINNISPTLFSIVVFFVLAFILKPIFDRKIFMVLGLSFIFPVFFGEDYIKIVFVFFIYLLSLCLFYLLFNLKNKYFIFGIRIFVYVCAFCIIIVKPQLINPFISVFSSDKLYENQLEKKLNDFNTSAILNLAKISQKDFNLSMDYKDISFTELNSAKKIIIDNKENLKEILSSIYNKEHKKDYKRVLQELENNASNLKNIILQIDKNNNNSFISTRLYEFLKSNFGKFNDLLYLIKRNFSFMAEKLTPQELATFDKKDNQEKLKNILSLLKFEQKFEEVVQTINQDKIIQGALKSTSILYSIILLLCVFSLQKTARKNSIVPS